MRILIRFGRAPTIRRLTDHLSEYLFVTEPAGVKNLINEGIPEKEIFYVGNIMIDTLKKSKVKFQKLEVSQGLGLKKRNYAVLTLRRPENVNNKEIFEEIAEALNEIQKKIKIVWPIHPRTEKRLREFNFLTKLKK